MTADISVVFVKTTIRRKFLMPYMPLSHSISLITHGLQNFRQGHALLVQFAKIGGAHTGCSVSTGKIGNSRLMRIQTG